MEIYTIGHSNHPLNHFLGLLQDHAITRLVDVRSTPYSRFNPLYNQKALQQSLLAHGIRYSYLSKALGGRPKGPAFYLQHSNAGKADKAQLELNIRFVMTQTWVIEGIRICWHSLG